jgi:methylthioribulose-1-phosphate dehydratase
MNRPGDRLETTDERARLATELCVAVRWLAGRDLAPATSGNFSVVLGLDPTRLLITSSGVDKRELVEDQLLVVDGEGAPVAGESLRPSAETLLHTRLVARRGLEIGCVLHTHSVWNTLVGQHWLARGSLRISGFELQKGIAGRTTHQDALDLPIVANHQDMTVLADWMDRALDQAPDAPGFLIAGHGLYTWGRTVAEARRHVESLEFLLECIGRRTAFRPY